MDELVSIIMPCHNGGLYIKEAIDSVIAQTYTNWELIIIDDNSTDSSVEVIKDYTEKDKRIKFYETEKSTGIPSTPRNVGILNANGRYIAFLDCDDIWERDKLMTQLPFFKGNDVVIVFSDYKRLYSDGSVGSTIRAPISVDFKTLMKGDCIGNLTGMYDTSKVGKIYQKELHAEDYLMWLEILKKNRLFRAINTGTCEGYYRINSSSLSGNKIKSAIWTWNVFRKGLGKNIPSSVYYFVIYAIKGVLKNIR